MNIFLSPNQTKSLLVKRANAPKMHFIKIFLLLLLCLVLTAITQIGGIILLVTFILCRILFKKINSWWIRRPVYILTFLVLYSAVVFLIIPPIAKTFGRVPLPIFEQRNLKPGNILTCMLARNYVKPALLKITYDVAQNMNRQFPGVTVNYLDANFPFIDKFPLLPHLSHNDGKKLDISFQYDAAVGGEFTNKIPSLIGYGICEEPKAGEENMPQSCGEKRYWQYNLLRMIIPQSTKMNFMFNENRTAALVNTFASHADLSKIFIEPHLKTRLKLTNPKIRFHGCQAVRHDDHIHVQVK